MKLGEKQVLTVVKIVDFGVYLGNDEEREMCIRDRYRQDNMDKSNNQKNCKHDRE